MKPKEKENIYLDPTCSKCANWDLPHDHAEPKEKTLDWREEFDKYWNEFNPTFGEDIRPNQNQWSVEQFIGKALAQAYQEGIDRVAGLPRYDVYDGGDAEDVDGSYIRVSDLEALKGLTQKDRKVRWIDF